MDFYFVANLNFKKKMNNKNKRSASLDVLKSIKQETVHEVVNLYKEFKSKF